MTGFEAPNHTQTPNELFDKYMALMGESELKVTLAVIRKTLGFHKKSDPISLTQLQKLTGLSRQGVIDGAEAAIARGLLEKVGTGKRGVIIYGMVIGADQSTLLTSQDSDQSTQETSSSQRSRHTKETTTKENINTTPLLDPFFEAIASVWNTRASGFVNAAKGMMRGVSRNGEWGGCNFEPPANPAEILEFGKWYKRKNPELSLPRKPEKIQHWFYEYRTAAAKKITPLDPEHDLSKQVEFEPILKKYAEEAS